MAIVVDATYENGVFRPMERVELREHDRVRLVIEPVASVVPPRRHRRIVIDPEIARAIAEDPEYSLWG